LNDGIVTAQKAKHNNHIYIYTCLKIALKLCIYLYFMLLKERIQIFLDEYNITINNILTIE